MADSPAAAEAAAAAGANGTGSASGLGDPDDYGFLYGLARAKCFRESALYGIGGGAVMGGLQLHRHRDAMRSAEMMVKAGCAFALISWVVCRKRYKDEREQTYAALQGAARAGEEAARRRAIAARQAARSADPPQAEQ